MAGAHGRDAQGEEENHCRDETRGESSARPEKRCDMEEGRVDQHQSCEAEREDRPSGRDVRRDHAQDDDQRIGDVEVFPTRREVEHVARPALPVEDELFQNVDGVGGGAEPSHRESVGGESVGMESVGMAGILSRVKFAGGEVGQLGVWLARAGFRVQKPALWGFLGAVRVWAVGAHQPCNHHRDIQDRQDGFDHGDRADLRRRCHNAGCAGRGHAAKAEEDEIETSRNRMQIDRGIEIEGMRQEDGEDGVEPREGKSDEEIDADRAEDGLRLRLFAHKDAAKDNHDGEDVKGKAENDRDGRSRLQPGPKEDCVLHDRRNRKRQSNIDEAFAEADRVDAHQGEGGAHHAEEVITHAGIAHVRVESEIGEQKEK